MSMDEGVKASNAHESMLKSPQTSRPEPCQDNLDYTLRKTDSTSFKVPIAFPSQ